MRKASRKRASILASAALAGGALFSGCQGSFNLPALRGEFSHAGAFVDFFGGALAITRDGVFLDFPGGFVEVSDDGVFVDAPGVVVEINDD